MNTNIHHDEILREIKKMSGIPTNHTSLDGYLGTTHPRYSISLPKLRAIAKAWTSDHQDLSSGQISAIVTSLMEAPSSTEKVMGGVLLDYITKEQSTFPPKHFDEWLGHLEGWAEVDALCTGKFASRAIPKDWPRWEKLINRFVKSKNVHKRRASLVLFCSPIRHTNDEAMRDLAFQNIERLSGDKSILITKAISWLLRSMIKQHKTAVKNFVEAHQDTLPAIAVRETLVTLKTGRKTKAKKPV